jgi:hypothetical protein
MSMSATAAELEVIEVKATSRERVFEFVNDKVDTFVILDCASFIHNLTITDKDDSYIYYLSISECEKIYDYIHKIYLSKRRCINYEYDQVFFNDCELNI